MHNKRREQAPALQTSHRRYRRAGVYSRRKSFYKIRRYKYKFFTTPYLCLASTAIAAKGSSTTTKIIQSTQAPLSCFSLAMICRKKTAMYPPSRKESRKKSVRFFRTNVIKIRKSCHSEEPKATKNPLLKMGILRLRSG